MDGPPGRRLCLGGSEQSGHDFRIRARLAEAGRIVGVECSTTW